MTMYILHRNDAKDVNGNKMEAYDAVTVDGLQSWWLVPSNRHRKKTTKGGLNLKEHDLVTVDGIIHKQWPLVRANRIERLNVRTRP
jgi:hypothetical protein